MISVITTNCRPHTNTRPRTAQQITTYNTTTIAECRLQQATKSIKELNNTISFLCNDDDINKNTPRSRFVSFQFLRRSRNISLVPGHSDSGHERSRTDSRTAKAFAYIIRIGYVRFYSDKIVFPLVFIILYFISFFTINKTKFTYFISKRNKMNLYCDKYHTQEVICIMLQSSETIKTFNIESVSNLII